MTQTVVVVLLAVLAVLAGVTIPFGDSIRLDKETGELDQRGQKRRWVGAVAHASLLEALAMAMLGTQVAWAGIVCFPLAAFSAAMGPFWLARRICAAAGLRLPFGRFSREWFRTIGSGRGWAVCASMLLALPLAGWGLYLANIAVDYTALWLTWAGWVLGVAVPAARTGTLLRGWTQAANAAHVDNLGWLMKLFGVADVDLAGTVRVDADGWVTVGPVPWKAGALDKDKLEEALVGLQPDRTVSFLDAGPARTVTFGWADAATAQRRAALKASGGLAAGFTPVLAATSLPDDGQVLDLTGGL